MKLSLLLPLTLLCAGVSAVSPSYAASSVVIWPIDPSMDVQDKATPLWIENRGTEPVTVQVRTYRWAQNGGENRHEPQNDVIASPPVAKVEPGARQLIRIIKLNSPEKGSESAYRLLIDELPKPSAEGDQNARRADLAVQMRYSIPLFVRGETLSVASPVTSLSAAMLIEGGERYVSIQNRGAIHARLTDLRLVTRGHETTVRNGLVGYVLPGATMRLALPSDAPADATVRVGINGQDRLLASGT
ncbi:fimbrial biogenesis chaperone [Sphingobium algorifonticola]|uniref:Molecular chaperone n=1 Tax=Sphingobium algorifonticola TaxID=2008318 RepID=A0A437JDK2_9SPHN|nr:molecular chaperone [Sphingobium algorifonticola]RVT43823.1 molecular chaperone [Sphingobium algorifonticola]